MSERAALRQSILDSESEIVALCQALVRVPSENPPGDTTTPALEIVERALAQWGIAFRRVEPCAGRPNLIATVNGRGDGRHLVYNGHVDVFPAGDATRWTRPPFSGAVEDGRLHGRGASDMKGGLTASLFAFRALAARRQHWTGRLTLTAVSDEETFGEWGSRYLLAHHPEVIGDVLLNAEPSSPQLLRFGERGMLWMRLECRSQGGHGGSTNSGRSAVRRVIEVFREIDEDISRIPAPVPDVVRARLDEARAVFDHVWGPGTTDTISMITINPGTMHGGTKVNMLAASAVMEIDIRVPPGLRAADLLEHVQKIVARHPDARMEVTNVAEPAVSDISHPIFALMQRAAEEVTGVRPPLVVSQGGTDARLWRYAGVPAAVYGPRHFGMGSPDEHILVEHVLQVAQVHALASWDFLGGAP